MISDDVKPDNMAVAASGRLAHIDLGCARLSGGRPIGSTEGFAAPEVDAEIASDTSPIYGWGRSMEFFAAGEVGLAPRLRLCDLHPWIGETYSNLIVECCSGAPEARPSAAELVERLRAIRGAAKHCGACPEGFHRFGDAPCFKCGRMAALGASLAV